MGGGLILLSSNTLTIIISNNLFRIYPHYTDFAAYRPMVIIEEIEIVFKRFSVENVVRVHQKDIYFKSGTNFLKMPALKRKCQHNSNFRTAQAKTQA